MVYEISWQEVETGDGIVQNDEFDIASASDVTINIKDDGTDTVTNRYLNLERRAKTVVLRPAATITIKTINGTELKAPITVVGDTNFTMSKGLMWDSFVITTETEPTGIKVLVS